MTRWEPALPPGYESIVAGETTIIALASARSALLAAAAHGTLYAFAQRHPDRRDLAGRGTAYAVPLPDGTRAVIRHNRHGGFLAPVTGDVFFSPTRAPHELRVAARLASENVCTPQILGVAIYPCAPLLARSDVVSREIVGSRDLELLLLDSPSGSNNRRVALDATANLFRALRRAGARHADLNLKNVLIGRDDVAYVIDVDRVSFHEPMSPAVAQANWRRFLRSARKWQTKGLKLADAELVRLARDVEAAL